MEGESILRVGDAPVFRTFPPGWWQQRGTVLMGCYLLPTCGAVDLAGGAGL